MLNKLAFTVFLAALASGLIYTNGCDYGGSKIKELGGVQGSGTTKSETRKVGDFTKIEANGAVSVEVTVGAAFAVEVRADDNLLANIKTETSGDTLKIYTQDDINSKSPIKVLVSMPEIENFEADGASNAVIRNVKSDDLDLKAGGASKIAAEGAVDDLNAEASGASTIDAGNLRAEKASVEASGASSATVLANAELEANASGASKIIYTGDPKTLKQDSSGASSITKK